MIDYVRTNWYGLAYLVRVRGILLPRLLPVIAFSAAISALVSSEAVEPFNWCPQELGGSKVLFGHPFAFQLFGVVFGYMSVARLSISMNRYWEGVSSIKIMHSKWADAVLQVLAFDRIDATDVSLEEEPFCKHFVHQIKQMSSLATIHLHGETLKSPSSMSAAERTSQALIRTITKKELRPERGKQIVGGVALKKDIATLHEIFDEEELQFLAKKNDKVTAQLNRILRSIVSRHQAGGINAPPPIVSRVFQELSNGMVAYHAACKIKEIPVPFALVHFNAVLLMIFNLTAPVVIACYTGSVAMSVVASTVVASGFGALWLLANELEDPFGYDANDAPMTRYHVEFCCGLDCAVATPWIERDYWTNDSGPWQASPCAKRKSLAGLAVQYA